MNEEIHIAVDEHNNGKADCEDPIREEETKLEQAYQLKEEANNKYKAKDYAGAVYLYHRCLLFARSVHQLSQWSLEGLAREERTKGSLKDGDGDATSNVTDGGENHKNRPIERSGDQRRRLSSASRGMAIKTEAADLMTKCYNNLAACIIYGPNRKEEDYLRAVEYCDKVLMQDKNNEKALFRKGNALAKANRYEQAITVLKKCDEHEAKVLIQKCEHILDEERRRRNDEIRRNFARHRENERNHGPTENVTMNGTVRVSASSDHPST